MFHILEMDAGVHWLYRKIVKGKKVFCGGKGMVDKGARKKPV